MWKFSSWRANLICMFSQIWSALVTEHNNMFRWRDSINWICGIHEHMHMLVECVCIIIIISQSHVSRQILLLTQDSFPVFAVYKANAPSSVRDSPDLIRFLSIDLLLGHRKSSSSKWVTFEILWRIKVIVHEYLCVWVGGLPRTFTSTDLCEV